MNLKSRKHVDYSKGDRRSKRRVVKSEVDQLLRGWQLVATKKVMLKVEKAPVDSKCELPKRRDLGRPAVRIIVRLECAKHSSGGQRFNLPFVPPQLGLIPFVF